MGVRTEIPSHQALYFVALEGAVLAVYNDNPAPTSIRELAKKTGVNYVTLMRLAKAKNPRDYNVTCDIIEKLCKYFGCESITELVEYQRK